jgi:hypothetical protein
MEERRTKEYEIKTRMEKNKMKTLTSLKEIRRQMNITLVGSAAFVLLSAIPIAKEFSVAFGTMSLWLMIAFFYWKKIYRELTLKEMK